jgi:peptide-methionine (S)-S-oxide reductase
MLFRKSDRLPAEGEALPGRAEPIMTPGEHVVSGRPLAGPYPADARTATFALGCFWGAERRFWETDGVWVTAVGYCGGATPNPTYEEVCSGRTGHAEAVRVVFLPTTVSYHDLLRAFWEAHDPTQGMRQGNDVGTQYRSGIYWHDASQREAAVESMNRYQAALFARDYGAITTEIEAAGEFFYAEEYHQQYLARNPGGYCGLGGTGIGCPAGIEEVSGP